MKLNKKGFTLIEVLAVIVILSMLVVIMVPSVNYLINKQKEDALKNLESTIISAARLYVSDYRYEISVSGVCNNSNEKKNVTKIKDVTLTNSKILLSNLVNQKYMNSSVIKHPKTGNIINLNTSSVKVQFDCKKRDYIFSDVVLAE